MIYSMAFVYVSSGRSKAMIQIDGPFYIRFEGMDGRKEGRR